MDNSFSTSRSWAHLTFTLEPGCEDIHVSAKYKEGDDVEHGTIFHSELEKNIEDEDYEIIVSLEGDNGFENSLTLNDDEVARCLKLRHRARCLL